MDGKNQGNEDQKQGDDTDLLKSTMRFSKFLDKKNSTYPIFEKVRAGKITEINEIFHQWSISKGDKIDNISKCISALDDEGKTPIHYTAYYNYKNLALYFLMKGANPFLASREGKTIFHVGCFMGHQELISIVVNYIRHIDRMTLLAEIQTEMRKFKFKRTDIKEGILISSDKHMQSVQDKFTNFQTIIYEAVDRFFDGWVDKYRNMIDKQDSSDRNPIHYACIDKFTKCGATSKFLLEFDLDMPGYDEFSVLYDEVQLLELDKEKRIDPRQYLKVFDMAQNFLKKEDWQFIIKKFRGKIKELRKDIVNHPDADGLTPLHLASHNGDFPSVQRLIKYGAGKHHQDTKRKQNVLDFAESDNVRKYLVDLQNASLKGDKKSLELLVNCGHDFNGRKSIFGVAPIHNAVISTDVAQKEILDYLILCDVNLDLADSNGWTALHHACKKGDLVTITTLIEKGASLQKFSNKGYYPIHIAAIYDQHSVIQFILSHEIYNAPKANVESRDNQQCTPLLLAAKKGNMQSVAVLLENGANLYSVDMHNWNALHHAVFNKQIKVINQLCRFDNDKDQLRYMTNKKGQLPKSLINDKAVQQAFHTPWNAASEGNLDIVRRLIIVMQEDFNVQTVVNKWTPLHLAIKGKHYLVVKFLVENKCKTDIEATRRLGILTEEQIQSFPENVFTAKGYAMELEDKKILQLFQEE